MVIWLNGSFGVGKTETANKLHLRLENSYIYDPELVGSFLWDAFPEPLKRKGDFQDLELWRSMNYQIIKYLSQSDSGHILIPMTLVNPDYFDQIIGRLLRDGVDVRHFILDAPKDTIMERLTRRGEPENSWAEQQIDRCIHAFHREIRGERIDTTHRSSEEVADYILARIGC